MTPTRYPRHAQPRHGLLVCLLACLFQALTWASMPVPIAASLGERVVICTANGMQSLSLADFKARAGQSQDDREGPDASPGCALCPFVGGLALTPAVAVLPLFAAGHYLYPAVSNTGPIMAATFETSQARAPPSIG